MTAVKTLLWSIFVPGLVVGIAPYLLLARFDSLRLNLSYFRFSGLIPILFGVMLYLWCAWYFTFVGKGTPAPFDPPQELVIKGPYQYARNPIYVFVALTLIGEAILFQTAVLVIYAALVVAFVHLWVVFYEEPGLRRRFGASYETYRRQVSRWLPHSPRLS